jgi:pantothenate kinase, type III
MNFLIDMGNTRLKWAITTSGQIIPGQPLMNDRINRVELIKLWGGKYRPRRLVIACVGANRLLDLVQSVAHEIWLDIEIIQAKSQAQAFGVINAYPQPEKLGVDRWLSLVAAWQKYRSPACIVDCGTAITVDLIDAEGKHRGGLISPGLTLMRKSLGQETEALPFTETNPAFNRTRQPSLANNTESAINSGVLIAAIGLIEHVLSKQAKNTRLILTGGDAELIAGHLTTAFIVEPDLVLRGLLCVLEGHT